jgi:toxin CptA
MKPVASLSVSLKPSQRLLAIQSLAHLVAAGAVLAANLPAWLAAILLLLTGASLAHVRRPLPVASLILGGDGGIEIVGADGTASKALVHRHTLVLSFLVVLLYRSQGRLRSMTLLEDSLPDGDFRQLRLWLRWRSAATNPA